MKKSMGKNTTILVNSSSCLPLNNSVTQIEELRNDFNESFNEGEFRKDFIEKMKKNRKTKIYFT